MNAKRSQNDPSYRLAAISLRDRIVGGEIKIGEALPSELAMAEMLQVNRSTVREAIRLLEESGVVQRKRGEKKLLASVPNKSELSNKLSTALVLHKVTLNELYRTMLALEPAIAAEAASLISEDQLASIKKNVEKTEAHQDDAKATLELDLEFHDLIASACKNTALQICRGSMSDLFYPAFDAVFDRLRASQRLLLAHTKIYEALVNSDARQAEAWMKRHIEDFRRGYELAELDIDEPISRLP